MSPSLAQASGETPGVLTCARRNRYRYSICCIGK
jgi:hypothetical protein